MEYQIKTDEQMEKYFKKLKKLSKGAEFHTITGSKENRLQQLKDIITKKRKENV